MITKDPRMVAQKTFLDAGHFAMDTRLDEVARFTDRYMKTHRNLFRPAAESSNCRT